MNPVRILLLALSIAVAWWFFHRRAQRAAMSRAVAGQAGRWRQSHIWGQYRHFGSWSVCRSGATVAEMEEHLREELAISLQVLPDELETIGEPVIEQFEHIPGKTYDGKITVRLQPRSEVA